MSPGRVNRRRGRKDQVREMRSMGRMTVPIQLLLRKRKPIPVEFTSPDGYQINANVDLLFEEGLNYLRPSLLCDRDLGRRPHLARKLFRKPESICSLCKCSREPKTK